jgi:hypothetical protein
MNTVVFVPGHAVTNPFKSLAGHVSVSVQHFAKTITQGQISAANVTDSDVTGRRLGVTNEIDNKLCLAKTVQFRGPALSVVIQALDVDSTLWFSDQCQVRTELIDEVTLASSIPKMVVGVNEAWDALIKVLRLLRCILIVLGGTRHSIRPPSTTMVCP